MAVYTWILGHVHVYTQQHVLRSITSGYTWDSYPIRSFHSAVTQSTEHESVQWTRELNQILRCGPQRFWRVCTVANIPIVDSALWLWAQNDLKIRTCLWIHSHIQTAFRLRITAPRGFHTGKTKGPKSRETILSSGHPLPEGENTHRYLTFPLIKKIIFNLKLKYDAWPSCFMLLFAPRKIS